MRASVFCFRAEADGTSVGKKGLGVLIELDAGTRGFG